MNRSTSRGLGARRSLLVFFLSVLVARADQAPTFELPRRGTGEPVRLEDFAGQVLVLDFFAYWCAPCATASRELELGVQQFYAVPKGNAHGRPVRVVSVNVEKGSPERTDGFVRQTGASFVVDDFSGSLLRQLGGAGLPFLAIVDGTGSRPGAPRFEVVYRHAGFEGTRKMRQLIDRLGGLEGTAAPVNRTTPVSGIHDEGGAGRPIVHTIETDPEFIWARDIFLSESKLQYGQQASGTEWTAAVSYGTYDMDYVPNRQFDFFGSAEHLREERIGGDVSLRQGLAERFTLLVSGGYYDGYPNYRRVWIANRYRQKYADPNYPTVPGYVEPEPKGWSGSTGLRWEYLPSVGYAEFKFGYAHEQTAPGYEDGSDSHGEYVLIRGREQIDTASLSLSSENVLTTRLRALHEFTFTQSTARKVRFSYQGSLNLALGERWVARGSGGISTEAPRFDAYFFGGTVECEVIPSLLVSLGGHYYKDTGEIENSLLTSSAAPPLESWDFGMGLRYTWRRSSFKIYAGPFWTNYARTGVGAAEFVHLYADRRWVLAQFAWSVQF